MKLKFARDDFAQDGLSSPDAESLARQRYSEWHHFTFSDDRAGLSGIVNLALSGDIRDPDRGRAAVSLIVHEDAHRWSGTMNVYGVEEARFVPGAIDLAIGPNAVRFDGTAYTVTAELKDRSVALDARWTPRAEAARIENMGGFINTFIVPRLDVDGSVRVAGRSIELHGANGYHDHNWGAWDWNRDLGWNWGYLLDSSADVPRDRQTAIVFGQITDATRASARTELVLLLWRGAQLTHIFLDDAVSLEALGRLAIDVPRVPGVMALFAPGRVGTIPERLSIDALDGADILRIDCRVRDAIQFLIPHPAGSTHTHVAELVGEYTVRGVIDGEAIAFTRGAFAELAGAGRTMHLPRVGIGV